MVRAVRLALPPRVVSARLPPPPPRVPSSARAARWRRALAVPDGVRLAARRLRLCACSLGCPRLASLGCGPRPSRGVGAPSMSQRRGAGWGPAAPRCPLTSLRGPARPRARASSGGPIPGARAVNPPISPYRPRRPPGCARWPGTARKRGKAPPGPHPALRRAAGPGGALRLPRWLLLPLFRPASTPPAGLTAAKGKLQLTENG